MDNKVVIAIVAGLLVLGAGYYLLGDTPEEDVVMQDDTTVVETNPDMMIDDEFQVEEDIEDMVTMELAVELAAVDAAVADQSGTATLSETNQGIVVSVNVTPLMVGVEQPAHIHFGECPGVGDVAYSLNPVIDGQSTTVLPLTMDELLAQGDLAINIHESQENLEVYTSCGAL